MAGCSRARIGQVERRRWVSGGWAIRYRNAIAQLKAAAPLGVADDDAVAEISNAASEGESETAWEVGHDTAARPDRLHRARDAGQPPAVVLVALVVGVALGGSLGVLIALPVTATLRAVITYLYDRAAAPLPEPVGAETVLAHAPPDHEST